MFGFFFFRYSYPSYGQLYVGSDVLRVEIVDTDDTRQRGLSGRDAIGSDGMFFVFSDARKRSFWMDRMRFPIDILFIRDGILREIAVDLLPPLDGRGVVTYRSVATADAVLEVPAGMVKDRGWEPGTSVFLK